MNTEIIYLDKNSVSDEQLKRGAELLAKGDTVVFPTETVYGLGANALDPVAVDKIYIAKGRPSDNPLILHIGCVDALDELVEEIPRSAKKLMDAFWPGPLTLIFKKSDKVPYKATGGLDTVAIRMPNHPIAKRLIELSGVPVAAPSANISGKPSPTAEEHVVKDLKGRVDMIICGGDTRVGLESTVLDITSEVPMILRPGGVTKEDILEAVGAVDIDPHLEKGDTLKPKSPGMKYTHYSPSGEVIVIAGEKSSVIDYINAKAAENIGQGLRVGIIASKEYAPSYASGEVHVVGSRGKLEEVAANIFDALRYFDREDIDIIYAESFPNKGIGQAIMNRLIKSAGYNIINV